LRAPRATLGRARPEHRGAVALALLALALAAIFTHSIPFAGGTGHVVRARFAQANEINVATPVRIGGVDVGHVRALDPGPDHSTVVVMQITQPGVRLHQDASAQIRWRTLLGGSMYLALDPGSPSAAYLRGPIPIARTASQVDWDQFNDQYPAPARRALRQLLAGLDQTLAAPAGEGATLHTLGPALQTIGRGADALRGQDTGDLSKLVRSSASALNALSSDQQSLQGLVDGAERTLAVIAADHTALAQTLQLTPPALSSTQLTMQSTNQTLTQLDPLVRALQPGANEIAPTTQELDPLLRQANRVLPATIPLLTAARPALTQLGAMSDHGTPLIAGLEPTIRRLEDNLIPFLDRTDPDTRLRNYEAIGPFASDLDSAAGQYDASGYLLRFDLGLGPNSVLLPCDTGLAPAQLARCNALNQVLGLVLGGGHQ
jgi:virulence factor Mce-like protein